MGGGVFKPEGRGPREEGGSGWKNEDMSLCTELTEDVRDRVTTSRDDDVTLNSAGVLLMSTKQNNQFLNIS